MNIFSRLINWPGFLFVVFGLLSNPNSLHAQWEQTSIKTTMVSSFATSGTTLFVGTEDSLHLSTNNGTSWTSVYAEEKNYTFNPMYFAVMEDNIFLAYKYFILASSKSNNFTQWNILPSIPDFYFQVYSLAISGTNLFAGGSGGIYLSNSNGSSWTLVTSGLPTSTIGVWNLAVRDTNLFAGIYGGGVFLSTNNGTSWTERSTGLPHSAFHSLVFSGSNLFDGTDNGVFLSTNNGINWTQVNTGLGVNTTIPALASSGTNLFAGTDSGVFLSTNNGKNWVQVNTGLPTGSSVYALDVSGMYLFAGLSSSSLFRGVWRRPLSEMITEVENINTETNLKFSLQQIYPNPFNTSTTIKYKVTEPGFVSLKVFNAMGTEVATLINEKKSVGEYSIEWNAAGLQSGIYFCRLQAGLFTDTKKLVLQK